MQPFDHSVLANLNRIAVAINHASSEPQGHLPATLRRIVEGAVELMAGGPLTGAEPVTAVIYAYDPVTSAFDPASRLAAGRWSLSSAGDSPRRDGLGARALQQRRRILPWSLTPSGLGKPAWFASRARE